MEKILIIDDDPLIVKYLTGILSRYDYAVEHACDGREGMIKAGEIAPDLILLDIMMPGMSGFEVTAELKKNPRTFPIPIILITSLDDPESKVKGLDAGADDFLTKPFDKTELRTRIRSMLALKRLNDQFRAMRKSAEFTNPYESETLLKEKNTIMIIEDDENMLKHYRQIFISGGYDSILAKNGAEALSILEKSADVDLLILDLILPDMSGMEILKKIRANSTSPVRDIPIIIISVNSDIKNIVDGIESGADDYLVKPANHFEILARIRTNLRKKIIIRKLEKEKEALFHECITDTLTGLYNRLYFKAHHGY